MILARDILKNCGEQSHPLAVGDFLLNGSPCDLGEEIGAVLPTVLADLRPGMPVVSRRDLNASLERLNVQLGDLFLDSGPLPGRLMPARTLVTGFLFPRGGEGTLVEARAIDIETSVVVGAARAFFHGRGARLLDPYSDIPLELEMSVTARPRGGSGEVAVPEGTELFSGDLVRLRVRPNRPAYVYVFFLDSQGNASVLFPLSRGEPQRQESRALMLPADGGYFRLDRHPGSESLLAAASLEPIEEFEALLENLDAAAAGSRSVKDIAGTLGIRGYVGISDAADPDSENLGAIMRSYTGTVWCMLSFEHRP